MDHRRPDSDETSRFAESVAAHLRSSEKLDPSFEQRVMQSVWSEIGSLYPVKPVVHRSWWRRPRAVRVTPLTGLALAAGLAGIVALSTLGLTSRLSSNPPAVAATAPAAAAAHSDTVTLVRFVFVDPGARSVELVGDFNQWTKGVTRLQPSGAPGVWAASVPLPAGRHEYAFIINGTRWIADPLATRTSDDFGVESSVIRVGGQSST